MKPEDLLADTLRDRTEQTDYPSTPMLTVAARARAIRARRRRTTILAAAAAVAVVAVPGAVWLGSSPDGARPPSHQLSSGPTSSPTTSSAGFHAIPEQLAAVPDLIQGRTFHGTYGDVTVPADAGTATPVRGGLLVSQPTSLVGALYADGTLGRLSLLGDHTRQEVGCGAARFAVSADRVLAAYWVANSCSQPGTGGTLYAGAINTMNGAGPVHWSTPPGVVEVPIGFVGSSVVVDRLRTDGTLAGVWLEAPGRAPVAVPGLSVAYDVDPNGHVAGTGGGRSRVVDTGTGQTVGLAPHGWRLVSFSPSGDLAGTPDGSGDGTAYAFIAGNGGFAGAVPPPLPAGLRVTGVGWDLSGAMLLVASDGTDSAVLRLDRDGTLTRATTVAADPSGGTYYRFASTP